MWLSLRRILELSQVILGLEVFHFAIMLNTYQKWYSRNAGGTNVGCHFRSYKRVLKNVMLCKKAQLFPYFCCSIYDKSRINSVITIDPQGNFSSFNMLRKSRCEQTHNFAGSPWNSVHEQPQRCGMLCLTVPPGCSSSSDRNTVSLPVSRYSTMRSIASSWRLTDGPPSALAPLRAPWAALWASIRNFLWNGKIIFICF